MASSSYSENFFRHITHRIHISFTRRRWWSFYRVVDRFVSVCIIKCAHIIFLEFEEETKEKKKTTKNIPEKKQSFRHFQIIFDYTTKFIRAPTNTQKLCRALRGLENTSFSHIWNLLFHYTSFTH